MPTNLTLLPHNNTILVKDITQKLHYIQLMQQLVEHFITAINCFESNMLSSFDAQVGETLCQVRAYKIYALKAYTSAQFSLSLKQLKKQCTMTNEILKGEEKNYQYYIAHNKNLRPESVRAQVTLDRFFKEMGCFFTISEDALFLFLSYFLCVYHIVDREEIPMAINYPVIAETIKLSRSYSKKVGHYYQKLLSELSCQFIFNLLDELPQKQELRKILRCLHRQSDEGRMVLPCYSVTEIIVLHMIRNNANLAFVVDIQSENDKERFVFPFQGSVDSGDFEPMLQLKPYEPCVVMKGSCRSNNLTQSSLFIKLRSVGIKNILLINNAAHPQYSGETLKEYRDNPFQTLIQLFSNELSPFEQFITQKLSSELIEKKQLAYKLGCTIENQRLFLLKHIFCNSLAEYEISKFPLMLIKSKENLIRKFV
ncbi:hypothetical protein [Legionella drozanskii]|uniref:hypothetical protein n=1 Tax=Legionella drozanskii TaxID=96228 RepID=UPI00104153F9|nr:hypothetical protein [Legionella drozanskii]